MTEKTGDEKYIELIMRMNEWQLLTEVMANTNYFEDSYYADFAQALEKRYEQLEELRKS